MKRKRSAFVYKIAAAYGAVFAALMVALTLLSSYYIARTSRELAILNQNEFANKALAQVESYLAEMEDVSYRTMSAPKLLNQFNRLQRDPRIENYFDRNVLADIDYGSLLGTINGPKPAVWRISVYNQYGDYVRTGAVEDDAIREARLRAINVGRRMRELRDLPNRMELQVATADPWSNIYSSRYVRMLRPLMNIYSEEVYGIVEVQQDIKNLRGQLGFETLTGVSVTVQSGTGEVILQTDAEGGGPWYEVSRVSDKYGWTVTLRQDESQMIAPYRPLMAMTALGGAAATVLVVLVIVVIARRLAQPLEALRRTVGGITFNNMPAAPAGEGEMDEVRELRRAFETMVGRIGDSVKLEKEAMFRTLQSQMNPHFLYNVLTVIGAAGMEGKCDQVVKMCSDTCAVLRYTTSYEQSIVTVGEDADNMRLYLELMKARYEDYFEYAIHIPPEVRAQPIPKMVLQPLAENCFSHGFSSVEPPYRVEVKGWLTPEGWTLSIADNGCGFAAGEKRALLEKIESYSESLADNYRNIEIGGCGLVNTALRLRFNGTRAAALDIEDNRPQGAVIVIKGSVT